METRHHVLLEELVGFTVPKDGEGQNTFQHLFVRFFEFLCDLVSKRKCKCEPKFPRLYFSKTK